MIVSRMGKRKTPTHRDGSTLVELMVVIAVCAVLVAIARPTARWATDQSASDALHQRIAEARREAVSSGQSRRLLIAVPGQAAGDVYLRPDGRGIGGEQLGIDLLTGRPQAMGSYSR